MKEKKIVGISLLQLIFAAFFILKITHLTNISEWKWYWIALPLVLHYIVKSFKWLLHSMNLPEQWRREVLDTYVQARKKQYLKKVLKDERSQIK